MGKGKVNVKHTTKRSHKSSISINVGLSPRK